MEELFDPAHIFNFVALLSYILIKELFLDKQKLSKELEDVKARKDPLKALELDLKEQKIKIINLEDAIESQGETISDKLDLILTDFKEKHLENKVSLEKMRETISNLGERVSAVEIQLKLKRR